MGKYTDFLKSQKGLKEGAYLIKEDFSGVERPISFDKGYQVSFMRPTDSYTDAETDAVIADIKRKVGTTMCISACLTASRSFRFIITVLP